MHHHRILFMTLSPIKANHQHQNHANHQNGTALPPPCDKRQYNEEQSHGKPLTCCMASHR